MQEIIPLFLSMLLSLSLFANEERNLVCPITVILSGTMKLNSDGTGTINSSNVGTEETPNGTNCPPIIIKTNCHLNLEKQKAN